MNLRVDTITFYSTTTHSTFFFNLYPNRKFFTDPASSLSSFRNVLPHIYTHLHLDTHIYTAIDYNHTLLHTYKYYREIFRDFDRWVILNLLH